MKAVFLPEEVEEARTMRKPKGTQLRRCRIYYDRIVGVKGKLEEEKRSTAYAYAYVHKPNGNEKFEIYSYLPEFVSAQSVLDRLSKALSKANRLPMVTVHE